jgi:hypothetical protein
MQHTSRNRWNIINKRLQHASETLATYATSPDLLLRHQNEIIATYIWNVLNNWNIHMQYRGGEDQGRLIPPASLAWPGGRTRTSATINGLRSAGRAVWTTGGASTTSTSACDGGEWTAPDGARGSNKAEWHLRSGWDGRCGARLYGGEEGTKGIRRFLFLFF